MIPFKQHVGEVAAGPGQLGPVARLAAEGEGIFEMNLCIIEVAYSVGKESQYGINVFEMIKRFWQSREIFILRWTPSVGQDWGIIK